jgi:dUTP pyrophosphatase
MTGSMEVTTMTVDKQNTINNTTKRYKKDKSAEANGNDFYIISENQYLKDLADFRGCPYEDLLEPGASTSDAVGYDFFSPFDFTLNPGGVINIPTGIKAKLDPQVALIIVPRSSLGFKYQVRLANTVGVIEAGYFDNPKNEGHIWVKLQNNGSTFMFIEKGEAFCQGLLVHTLRTNKDNRKQVKREGGLGSTNKKEENRLLDSGI